MTTSIINEWKFAFSSHYKEKRDNMQEPLKIMFVFFKNDQQTDGQKLCVL